MAELALINSVQEGLASKLDMQAIYDLVGDKIREIFRTDGVAISRIDQEAGLVHVPYFYKQDQRFHSDSEPLTAEERREIHMPRTELWDTDAKVKIAYERGDIPAPGTTMPRSVVDVPLVANGKMIGKVRLIDIKKEHAYSESAVRLLETLANSMSVALENARLFDETQRLLKITEERNAELAIINNLQQGLASKLNMQAIYDLVGDKIQEIFDAQIVAIFKWDQGKRQGSFAYGIEGEHITDSVRGLTFDFNPAIEHQIRTHESLNLNGKESMERWGLQEEVGKGDENVQSLVSVPLLVGAEATGCISLQSTVEHAFSESDGPMNS